MIEIFSIILQTLIFFVMFSFPFNEKVLDKTFNLKKVKFQLIDSHAINIIFFSYICLVVSLLGINLKTFFKIYLTLSLIYILFNFKWFLTKIKKDDFIKFIFFFLIAFSIFIFIAQNIKLEWDGHVWISKALVFLNGEKIINLSETLHPDYPYLGTYLWAFFWGNSYLELEYFGRYFYVYFYLISLFLILEICNIKNNYLKISLILFLILLSFEPYYFAGYQEYLIFSTLIIASKYIYIHQQDNKKNIKLMLMIFLILYLNSWFKNEGEVYFLIFSIPLIYLASLKNNKKLLLILFIIILMIIKYAVDKYFIKDFTSQGTEHLFYFLQNLGDIKYLVIKTSKILLNILIVFIKHPLWIVAFLSIFVQSFIFKKISLISNYFVISLVLNLLTIFAVYVTMGNIDFMLKVTLDRVLFQTSGFYIVLFLSILNFPKLNLNNKII